MKAYIHHYVHAGIQLYMHAYILLQTYTHIAADRLRPAAFPPWHLELPPISIAYLYFVYRNSCRSKRRGGGGRVVLLLLRSRSSFGPVVVVVSVAKEYK